MTRHVTMKDIAARAHVSVSTVSYALNDSSALSLSPETRARVRKIAKELGYVPNSWARALRSSSSGTIGVLLDKPLTLARYATVVEGMRGTLRDHDVRMSLLDVRDESDERTAIDDYRAGRVDGLVFVGHDEDSVSEHLADAVARYSLPFVALDCGNTVEGVAYSTVDFDYAAGVRQMVDHLVDLGIVHVVHVRPTSQSRAERLRESELLRVVGRHPGVTLQVVHNGVVDAELRAWDRAHTQPRADYPSRLASLLRPVLSTAPAPPSRTAVLCSWGADTEAVYQVAHLVSPSFTVAALAAGTLSESLWPGLRYSRLPLAEAGRACAEAILGELATTPSHVHALLPPSLGPGAGPRTATVARTSGPGHPGAGSAPAGLSSGSGPPPEPSRPTARPRTTDPSAPERS